MSYLKKWLNYFQVINIIAELEDVSGKRNLNDQSSSYVHCKGISNLNGIITLKISIKSIPFSWINFDEKQREMIMENRWLIIKRGPQFALANFVQNWITPAIRFI